MIVPGTPIGANASVSRAARPGTRERTAIQAAIDVSRTTTVATRTELMIELRKASTIAL